MQWYCSIETYTLSHRWGYHNSLQVKNQNGEGLVSTSLSLWYPRQRTSSLRWSLCQKCAEFRSKDHRLKWYVVALKPWMRRWSTMLAFSTICNCKYESKLSPIGGDWPLELHNELRNSKVVLENPIVWKFILIMSSCLQKRHQRSRRYHEHLRRGNIRHYSPKLNPVVSQATQKKLKVVKLILTEKCSAPQKSPSPSISNKSLDSC